MKNNPTLRSLLVAAVLGVSSDLFAQTPITLTGWNKDLVYENDGSPSVNADFGEGYTFTEHGLSLPQYDAYTGLATGVSIAALGLPSSASLTSLATNTVLSGSHSAFALQNYSAPNAVFLQGAASVTLTLPTAERFSTMAFLGTSISDAPQAIRVTLNFQDNSTQSFTYSSQSWRSEAGYGIPLGSGYPNPELALPLGSATSRLDRVKTTPSDRVFDQQRKWIVNEADVNLAALGFDQKAVQSITFTKENIDSNISAIFAVSGSHAGSVQSQFQAGTEFSIANNYNSNQIPTTNSDDVLVTTTAGPILTISVYNLTMGSLNITNGVDYSIQSGGGQRVLTLGAGHNSNSTAGAAANDLIRVGTNADVTIVGASGTDSLSVALGRSGNFNVASNATLAVTASVTGTGFGINKTGAGTVSLSGNNAFSGATVITAGKLDAASQGALLETNGITINSGGTLLLSGVATNRVNDGAAVGVAAGGNLAFAAGNQNTTEILGSLTLTTGSTVDFDSFSSGNFVATFASLILGNNVAPVTGYATIMNWNGAVTQGFGANTDRLLFNSDPGVTSTEAIRFNIAGTLHSARFVQSNGIYELLPNQTLSAVPEPTTLFSSLVLLIAVLTARRQRALRCVGVAQEA